MLIHWTVFFMRPQLKDSGGYPSLGGPNLSAKCSTFDCRCSCVSLFAT